MRSAWLMIQCQTMPHATEYMQSRWLAGVHLAGARTAVASACAGVQTCGSTPFGTSPCAQQCLTSSFASCRRPCCRLYDTSASEQARAHR